MPRRDAGAGWGRRRAPKRKPVAEPKRRDSGKYLYIYTRGSGAHHYVRDGGSAILNKLPTFAACGSYTSPYINFPDNGVNQLSVMV